MLLGNGRARPEVFHPLWDYIALSDYTAPGAPARETVRKGFTQFWDRVHTKTPSEFQRSAALRSLPYYVLGWAAPPPSSTQAVLALQHTLPDWIDATSPQPPTQVIVGPPGSGAEQVVRDFGQRVGWRCIEPPSMDKILSGGSAWFEQVTSGTDPIIIPQLHKCYLRHHNGLDLMNRLLDWLEMTDRQCLLACDSWAWNFLVKAMQIDAMLPAPLTLAPFHAARLQFWLPLLARRTHKNAFVFRYLNDGAPVFSLVNQDELEATRHPDANRRDKYADWLGADYFLKQLAAHSRGIPGVAWTYWRNCLQIAEDGDIDQAVVDEARADRGYTLWVKPWSQVRLPIVPGWAGTQELFILHALLLHGGLSAEVLAEILPFSDNEVRQISHRLRNEGLVGLNDGVWHVTLLGYPAVRQFLASEGYLVDTF